MSVQPSPLDDPRWQKLMARGGMISLPHAAPDGWPHGEIPAGENDLEHGDDRLSKAYCTLAGRRFLRAVLLLPIEGARTVFAFECWGCVSEESWQGWLSARVGGPPFVGSFAWLANGLAGFECPEAVPCNLVPGPPGQPPRLQPHPGTALHAAQTQGVSAARLAEIYAAAGQDIAALLTD